MLISRRGKIYKIISTADKKRSCSQVQYFAALFSFLQLVATIICVQAMFSSWSEITIVWPIEFTICVLIGLTFIALKIAQMFSIASNENNTSKFWKIFLLGAASIALLTCGVLACNIGRTKYSRFESNNTTSTHSYFEVTKLLDILLSMDKIRSPPTQYNNLHLQKSMENYDLLKLHMIAWDIVQGKYECCGTDSANDWMQIRGQIPRSCCQQPFDIKCKINDAYANGCAPKLRLVLFEQTGYIEITMFLLLLLETVIAAFTIFKVNCEVDKKTVTEAEKTYKSCYGKFNKNLVDADAV